MTAPPTIQYVDRDGVLGLGWGHPNPSALPVEAWRAASQETLRTYAWQALAYGYAAGPGPLVDWIADRLRRTDTAAPGTAAPTPRQVFVTAGASHALELVSAVLTRPGDAVLVDSPTYHLALRILADHDVDLIGVPADEHGLDPAGTGELLHRLRAQGRRVPLLYLVPTFGNPTGACLPAARRRALVDLAGAAGLTIVEDDTYRELCYDGVAPPSLWSLASGGPVVRIGSFAKTVAPGLRLGWLTAEPDFVRRLAQRGVFDSGGGVNHTTALTMATFGASGRYDEHVPQIRRLYRRNRDALVAAVTAELPATRWETPRGGWFLWLRLPEGVRATQLLDRAEAEGVSFLPGTRFYVRGGGEDRIRLSFSMLEPERLAEGVRRLAKAFPPA